MFVQFCLCAFDTRKSNPKACLLNGLSELNQSFKINNKVDQQYNCNS